MRSNRDNLSQKVTDFVGSYFRQSHQDFKASHHKRKDQPLYAVTRYFPSCDDLPLPLSDNRYTAIRQTTNTIGLLLFLYGMTGLAMSENCTTKSMVGIVAFDLCITMTLNMYLQHVIYPDVDKTGSRMRPHTS